MRQIKKKKGWSERRERKGLKRRLKIKGPLGDRLKKGRGVEHVEKVKSRSNLKLSQTRKIWKDWKREKICQIGNATKSTNEK